jgi:hypothetical protein
MVDRPMVIVGSGEMVDSVFIGEALRPAFHLGSNDGFDRRGAHVLEHFEIDLRGECVLVSLVTALRQAQQGGTAHLGGGATAQLQPALSGCAVVTFDFTRQPFAARTLVALIRFHVVLQLAGRVQMVRLVDAPIQQMIHRCAVRSWISAAAAMSVAFSFNCHKPITSNHSRGLNVLSSKIELVQSVHMANCWPQRTAQGTQLKRCRPLSHRSRGSTAALRQRGHVTPSGQRNWRK